MEACKNDELALLHALKSSNHKAFEVLYYRYSPRLYRHILNLVKVPIKTVAFSLALFIAVILAASSLAAAS